MLLNNITQFFFINLKFRDYLSEREKLVKDKKKLYNIQGGTKIQKK